MFPSSEVPPRLVALASSITKLNEDTSVKRRYYWAAQATKLNYPNDKYVQTWWDAAWGKVAENSTPTLEIWSLSKKLPLVDLRIARAVGSLRKSLDADGIPKGKTMSAYNSDLVTWCYSIHDLSPVDRARVLAALTVHLPHDLMASPYDCWERSWAKMGETSMKLPETAWSWIGPRIFDDAPAAIQYLCEQIPMQPVLESMLQINTDGRELPLMWHP